MVILSKKEQKKLYRILKLLSKIEKGGLSRLGNYYFPYITLGVTMVTGLFLIIVAIILKYEMGIMWGAYLSSMGTVGFIALQQNIDLGRIIKKLYDEVEKDPSKISFANDEENKWVRIITGICFLIMGLGMAFRNEFFRNELMYLAKSFLKLLLFVIPLLYVIPLKIIGFTMAGIGLLIIIIPPIIRKLQRIWDQTRNVESR